jgi:signal transduction histidine kinase
MQPSSLRARLLALLTASSLGPLLLLWAAGAVPGWAFWLLPLVLFVHYGLTFWLLHPVEELLAAVRRLKAGDLKARALLEEGSPWHEIGSALFALAERLDQVTRHLEDQVRDRTAALARKADQLRAVGQVGQQVAAVLEPEGLLHFVVRVMRGTFGYDLVAVLLRHEGHLVLAACAARGVEEVPLGRVFPRGPAAPPFAAHLEGEGGLSASPVPLLAGVEPMVELAVPIRLGDRPLGLLLVQRFQPHPFDEEDLFTARTIAGQVAVALENARLLEAERQLRALSIAEERNRMAREIHDTLAQGFMGILMQLRAMQAAADPEAARFHLSQAEALAREGLQEARRSVWNLRPRPLESGGLSSALAAELESVGRRGALQTELQTEGDVDRLPGSVETTLLRIAQEALHNCLKYAQANKVVVRLAVYEDRAELEVADDGVGFDPAALAPSSPAGGGFGLRGMAERARLAGGTLAIEAAPGAGCRVRAMVPLPVREEDRR